MGKLTARQVNTAPTKAMPYKLTDGGGLYLQIAKNVALTKVEGLAKIAQLSATSVLTHIDAKRELPPPLTPQLLLCSLP